MAIHRRTMQPSNPTVVPSLSAAFCFLLLAPLCLGARHDEPNPKSLYDAHRWFELRDLVARSAASVFYQGAVACAFNDLQNCEKELGAVIKSQPQSDEVVEAHRLLGSTYFRLGKYR